MSTAHIFYIPLLVLVGIFAGYFIGRHMAEVEEHEKRKKARRRAAAAQKSDSSEEGSETEPRESA